MRTFVIVQITCASGVTLTPRGPVPPPLASTVVSCLHSMLEVYSDIVVPAEATSPTVCVPVETVTAPVVPLSPAPTFFETPSIWRSKRPGSVDGRSVFTTSIVPVFGVGGGGVFLCVFVTMQTTFAPGATSAFSDVPLPLAIEMPATWQSIELV